MLTTPPLSVQSLRPHSKPEVHSPASSSEGGAVSKPLSRSVQVCGDTTKTTVKPELRLFEQKSSPVNETSKPATNIANSHTPHHNRKDGNWCMSTIENITESTKLHTHLISSSSTTSTISSTGLGHEHSHTYTTTAERNTKQEVIVTNLTELQETVAPNEMQHPCSIICPSSPLPTTSALNEYDILMNFVPQISVPSSSSSGLQQKQNPDMYFNFDSPVQQSTDNSIPTHSQSPSHSLSQSKAEGEGKTLQVDNSSFKKADNSTSEDMQRKRQADRAARNRESSRRAREKAKRRFRALEVENCHLHQVIHSLQIQHNHIQSQLQLKSQALIELQRRCQCQPNAIGRKTKSKIEKK